MNFELESWEVPPGADANNLSVPIEFGPVEWNGKSTMMSARTVPTNVGKSLAFFRPHGAGINYAVLINDQFGEFKARVHGKKLERIVREALRPKTLYLQSERFYFGRVFHLQDQFCVVRAGESFLTRTQLWLDNTPLEFPFDIAIEPSIQVNNWLAQQWRKQDSDVRLTWEWNRKDDEERETWWGEIMPRWNELRQLMRAVATIIELASDQIWPLTDLMTFDYTAKQLAHLEQWDEFLPHQFSFELPAHAPQFLRDYLRYAERNISVRGAEVSAHQKLEARLYLRDWLQIHAPQHLHLIQ